jgi:hypothetical protein
MTSLERQIRRENRMDWIGLALMLGGMIGVSLGTFWMFAQAYAAKGVGY